MIGSARALRLLEVVEAAGAGVGRHVLDLTDGLLARGHEVHLVYSPTRADGGFCARLAQLRNDERFHAFVLPMRRAPHWSDVAAIRSLRGYARRHGPFDVVHFHSSKAGLVGRLAFAASATPVVYTPHALYSLAGGRAIAAFGERLLARFCDRIILVSRAELDHALSIGLPRKKLQLIYPGIRGTDTQPGCAQSHPDRVVRIGFVGRLVEQKSPETLLRAFQILSTQMRCTRLAIVGDGPLYPRMRNLAHELGIGDRVDWLGESDGPSAMRGFDIFALTSKYEGFPYTILEAMSAALPVVATDVGGTSETIHDGENGIVVPVGDVDAVAKALGTLSAAPDLCHRMGAASRRIVMQFSFPRMMDHTLSLYRALHSHVAAEAMPPTVEVPKSVGG